MLLSPLIVAAACSALPPITFVDANLTTGANDGTSWENAYRGSLGLGAALDAGARHLWVADGTYYPGPPGSPASTHFQLGVGTEIRGGFSGGESDPSMADPIANRTVLSGDLPGGPAGQPELEAIVRISGIPKGPLAGVTLDGLILDVSLSGPTQPTSPARRALIVSDAEGVLIRACTMQDGHAARGGGVLVTNAAVDFEHCAFERNRASQAGGGVYADRTSTVCHVDCVFEDNIGGIGAGLFVGAYGSETAGDALASVLRCMFTKNTGAIGGAAGGGIFCRRADLDVRATTFRQCVVPGGGGGLFGEDSTITVDRCRFVECAAPGDGGGAIYANNLGPIGGQTVAISNTIFIGNGSALFAANGAVIDVEHTTIANGRPPSGQPFFIPAIVATGSTASTILLRNTIVWGNAPVPGAPVGGTVFALGNSSVSFTRCTVEGWSGGVGAITGSAMLTLDPLFVDEDGADAIIGSDDDDLRLRLASPCVDAADATILEFPAAASQDLLSNPRPFDVPTVANGGPDPASAGDIGCHERSLADCPFDLTFDGAVDAADLAVLLGAWGDRSSSADLDGDRTVGAADLAVLLGAFGQTCD